ncbi:MAG: ATP-binding protein [Chitinophagales bacterium]
MNSIPQVIQELEQQLAQTEGLSSAPLLIELYRLYGSNGAYDKSIECAEKLLHLGEKHQNDQLKIEGLLAFAKMECTKQAFDKTHAYLNEVRLLNEKVQDRKTWLIFHQLKGDIYQKQRQFDDAQKHLEQLLILATEEDLMMKVHAYQLLGGVQQMTGNFDQALQNQFKALKLIESVVDKQLSHKKMMGILLINIATLYLHQNDAFDKETTDLADVIHYLEKAKKIATEIEHPQLLTEISVQLGRIEMDRKNYDTALQHFHSALQLAKTFNNPYILLYCSMDIANIHKLKNELDTALIHYTSALDLSLKLNNQSMALACYINLASYWHNKQHLQQAMDYAQQALDLAQTLQSPDKSLTIYQLMASIHKALGNTDEVFDYLQKYIGLKDKLFTNEKQKNMVEMQTRYETEKREQEAQQLRELEEMKGRFFSQITHEFRTPLTLILGPIQQLLQNTQNISPTQLQNRLTLVERNGQRLMNLVNQLLDLSKLESGKMTIQTKHGDVVDFVNDVVTNFQSLAQQQNIHLHFETSLPQLSAHFDVDKLEKILYNLLSNALKFTPSKGKITLQLQNLHTSTTHTSLQITLLDTGKGIAASQLPYIFDRFYQADNSNIRQAEGSGVGLSLVKELLELQGGSIEVQSKIGEGTTFTFQLPLELASNIAALPQQNLPTAHTFAPTLQSPTIVTPSKTSTVAAKTPKNVSKNIVLVVEDNADMQTYIESILSPQYEVLQAMNGEDGVEMALEQIPDLIVSDVMMPQKDGYTLCKELKSNEKTNHIPIILLTAKAALNSRLEGLQQGADVYLSKPFSPEELLLNIENQIKVRQQLQEKYTQILETTKKEEVPVSITDPFLQRLIETIESHLNDFELSVEQLSQYMFMSRQQIHRKLHALTNYSTSEFIRLLRLKKAKTLLESKQHNITEIAYEVGFSSPSYFSRAFVKQFGVSPSKWVG